MKGLMYFYERLEGDKLQKSLADIHDFIRDQPEAYSFLIEDFKVLNNGDGYEYRREYLGYPGQSDWGTVKVTIESVLARDYNQWKETGLLSIERKLHEPEFTLMINKRLSEYQNLILDLDSKYSSLQTLFEDYCHTLTRRFPLHFNNERGNRSVFQNPIDAKHENELQALFEFESKNKRFTRSVNLSQWLQLWIQGKQPTAFIYIELDTNKAAIILERIAALARASKTTFYHEIESSKIFKTKTKKLLKAGNIERAAGQVSNTIIAFEKELNQHCQKV